MIENVRKLAPQRGECLLGRVERYRAFLFQVEGTDVIEPKDMIGMPVGIDHGVESVHPGPHRLQAKIRGGIDHYVALAVSEQYGRSRSLIERVLRLADRAMAPERGHAHRGARPQHCQLKSRHQPRSGILSMRRIL